MATFYDSRVATLLVTDSGSTSRNVTVYIVSVDGLPGVRRLNDVTTFGSTGRRYSPGLEEQTVTIDMIHSVDANVGSDTVFGPLRTYTAATAFTYNPSNTAASNYVGNWWVEDYVVLAKIGDAVKSRVTCRVDNGVARNA